jgi:hypothetical protein
MRHTRRGPARRRRSLLRALAVLLAAWPDYGFTRGEANPRQVQWFACPTFPECHTRPVRHTEVRGFLFRWRRCEEHGFLMNLPVVWKPHT